MKLIVFLGFVLQLGNYSLSQAADSLEIPSVVDSTKTVVVPILPTIPSTIAPDSLQLKNRTPNGKQIDGMIKYAKSFLGTPYHYSGTTPSGFDCSGFINYVMGDFGFELTRSSYGLAELGRNVKLSDLRPGDLMFFKGRNVNSTNVGHVSMVVEVQENEIKMIHASSSRGVVIDNFTASSYYVPRFIKAKRLDYGNRD